MSRSQEQHPNSNSLGIRLMLLEYSIYLSEDSCRIMPWISLCSFVYSSGLTPVSYSIQMSKFLAQLSFRIMRDGNLSSVKFRIKDKMRLQNLSNSQYGALVYLQRSILGMRKEIFSESFHFRISSCLPVKWSGEPCHVRVWDCWTKMEF